MFNFDQLNLEFSLHMIKTFCMPNTLLETCEIITNYLSFPGFSYLLILFLIIVLLLYIARASLVAQKVKRLPATWETWV